MDNVQIKYNETYKVNLIYNETGRKDLQGNLEINQGMLRKSMNSKSAFIEGGWYFNNYPKMRSFFPNHDIHYIVLNPSIETIHKNYLKRHPNSKKHKTNDFVDWDRTVYNVRSKSALKLVANNNIQTTELTTESLETKIEIILNLFKKNNIKTIFVITGSNCAGKSFLYKHIKERLEKIA